MTKISKSELYYFLFLLLSIIPKFIGLNGDNQVYRIMFYFSIIILLYKILFDNWKIKEIIVMLIILFFLYINYTMSGSETLLYSTIILLGVKSVRLKNIFYFLFYTRVVFFFIIISLSLLDIIPNHRYLIIRNDITYERYSYGFYHPNILHQFLFEIVLLYFIINFKKIDYKIYLFFGIINIFVYSITFSRTGFLIINIIFFISIIIKSGYLKRTINFVLIYTPLFFTSITIFLGYFYDKYKFIQELDMVLTGRIYFSYLLFKNNVNLLGINNNENKILYDNSYFTIISTNGLLGVLFIIFIYYYFVKDMIKNYKFADSYKITLITIYIYAFTENIFMNALVNISLFLIAKYYLDNKKFL